MPIHHSIPTVITRNQTNDMPTNGKAPSVDPSSKPHRTVPKRQSASPKKAAADRGGYRKRTGSSFKNSSEAVSHAHTFPSNVPEPAVISTNITRDEPANPTRQSTQCPEKGPRNL